MGWHRAASGLRVPGAVVIALESGGGAAAEWWAPARLGGPSGMTLKFPHKRLCCAAYFCSRTRVRRHRGQATGVRWLARCRTFAGRRTARRRNKSESLRWLASAGGPLSLPDRAGRENGPRQLPPALYSNTVVRPAGRTKCRAARAELLRRPGRPRDSTTEIFCSATMSGFVSASQCRITGRRFRMLRMDDVAIRSVPLLGTGNLSG